MKKKNMQKRPPEFDKFAFGNASSMTECTGLITHQATDEELEAYREVYDFYGSPAVSDKSEEQIKEGKNIF